MYLIEEHNDIMSELQNAPEILNYQEVIKSQAKGHSWFRKNIIDPIIKPILIKVFREYGELIAKTLIEILLKRGKL